MMMYDKYGHWEDQPHWFDNVVWGFVIVAAFFIVYLIIKNQKINEKRKQQINH